MNATTTRLVGLGLIVGLGFAGNCRDDTIGGTFVQQVAVTAGDFDDIAAPFKRNDIAHDVFEGIISTATWDEDYNAAAQALKVEDLFLGNEGAGQLRGFGAVFVASGTRGFGARQYNGLDEDNELVNDSRVQDNVERYVTTGGTLFVTDWAYELIETIWPENLEFFGPEPARGGDGWENLDAAQVGVIVDVTAEITDPDLAEALGVDILSLEYPYSNFVLLEDVGSDVTVYMRGTVSYRPELTAEPLIAEDVPLLVGFETEGGGNVYYATFHVDAQRAGVMDDLITHLVGTFETTTGSVDVE